MMKSRVAITTYANYEIVITRRIIPYFKPFNYTLQDLEQHPKSSKTSISMSWIVALRQTPLFTIMPTSANA